MDNEDRVKAICWLDSGVYPTQSVASRFGMTSMELESELAAFKSQPVYQDKCFGYVQDHTRSQLADCPFMAWKDGYTLRTLKNGRIECVICELGSNKFFHFHLPDKDYLDHICNNTRWLAADMFSRELALCHVTDWSLLRVDEQLAFLLKRYDSDIFLPFCRRIDKMQFVSLTGQSFPVVGGWSMDDGERLKQTPGDTESYRPDCDYSMLNKDLDKDTRSARYDEICKVSSLISTSPFSYFWEGDEIETLLVEADLHLIQMLLMTSDSERLQRLACDGPRDVECMLLYRIDPFYGRYKLMEAFKDGEKSKDYSQIKMLAQEAFERIAAAVKMREMTRMKAPAQSGLQVPKNGNKCSPVEGPLHTILDAEEGDNLDEAFASLESVLSGLDTTELTDARKLFDDNFRKKMPGSLIDRVVRMFSAFMNGANDGLPSEPGMHEVQARDPKEAANEKFEKLRTQRKSLLTEMASKGMVRELVDAFRCTETEILKYSVANRPSFYPEHDFTLYGLYLSGKVPTQIVVKQQVVGRLSSEELDEIYNKLN